MTERLRLRPIGESDLPEFAALWADPANMTYIDAPWTAEQARQGLAAGQQRWSTYGVGPWMVDLKRTAGWKTGIGVVSFRDVADDGTAEFGWMITSRHRRQGIAFEASSTAVQWYFEHFESDVLAKTQNVNVASLAVLNKLGFSLTTSGNAVEGRLSHTRWTQLRA